MFLCGIQKNMFLESFKFLYKSGRCSIISGGCFTNAFIPESSMTHEHFESVFFWGWLIANWSYVLSWHERSLVSCVGLFFILGFDCSILYVRSFVHHLLQLPLEFELKCRGYKIELSRRPASVMIVYRFSGTEILPLLHMTLLSAAALTVGCFLCCVGRWALFFEVIAMLV